MTSNSNTDDNINDKLKIMKEDYENEWWKAGERDNYNLKNKLTRVGCRPLKRKYFRCLFEYKEDNSINNCKKIKEEVDKCNELLYVMHLVNEDKSQVEFNNKESSFT